MKTHLLCTAAAILAAAFVPAYGKETKVPDWARKDIRAGMVGLDTSHCVAFAGQFHAHPEWRVKIVAALPEGSKDMPKTSLARLDGFVATLRSKYGVEIVESMDELLKRVDVVLIESVDGRPHLRQARPALQAGKPVFIDKPFTASVADAREIVRLSKQTGVPFFSCSCVRFQPEIVKLCLAPGVGKVTKAQGSSPMHIEPHHSDLFWYGVHGVEALYTALGPGCVSVKRRIEGDLDITTGTWKDGRVGVFRGVRKGDYKPLVTIWGADGKVQSTGGYTYTGLCITIAKFFQTGKAPIDPLESLEIVEFMAAAQLSKDRSGASVKLDELRKPPARQARQGAPARRNGRSR